MTKTVSINNPIVRLPKSFLNLIEPDKRIKKVKLSFSISDDKLIISKHQK